MKACKTLPALIILLAFIVPGCVFNMTHRNREKDKADAKAVADRFFLSIQNKNYDMACDLFSNDFFSATPKDTLKSMFLVEQNNFGDLLNFSLKSCETKVVTGTDPSAKYYLIYTNHYQKHNTLDSIGMSKDNSGKIKIVFFHVRYLIAK